MSNPLYDLFQSKRLTRAVIGSVLIVNDHGLMLDRESGGYSVTHFNPDGKVVTKKLYPTMLEAATALVMLKRSLEKTTLFMPDRKFLQ